MFILFLTYFAHKKNNYQLRCDPETARLFIVFIEENITVLSFVAS